MKKRAKGQRPICPKCGSVAVVDAPSPPGAPKRCRCTHCEHTHSRWRFTNYISTSHEQTKWRDPIALTPGGYEDNS